VAIILDGVMTPVNVGSIVRLAAAYGASPLWMAGATADVGHPGAQKTALGTDRFVDIIEGVTAVDAAAAARDDGFQVIAVELAEGATPLHDLDVDPDACIVLGHEDHGLSPAVLAACDAVAYLPLVGRVASLNVATAAGIALYELRRREWTGR
jgi:tRNA (guanosine-2'-O-)-methyltransferase